MDEEGYLTYTNRAKRMIISSGYNVYPNQIEKIIETHPSVMLCTVVGVPDKYKMEIPKAYIVLKKDFHKKHFDKELTPEEMDEQLFQLLSGVVIKYPSAMPREYEIIVYLTKNQLMRKIKQVTKDNKDRETLREYFNNTPYGCTVYAPINAMKNKLAGADVDFDATMCDMSALKFILIDERIREQKTRPGFMGYCTFISYKDIDRTELTKDENDDIDL